MAALACAGPLRAHHSISMIETATPIWVKGTVVSYEAINPHVLITLDQKNDDGQVERWTIEGPILARLARMKLPDNFLQAGDVIEVCGFPLKQEMLAKAPVPRVVPALFMHGHLLVMPDGLLRPWGPYGKLANCVRPSDTPQSWADFVNTNAMGLEYWCRSVSGRSPLASTPSVASKAFMDQVNGRLAKSCE
jgi:hypothetical protein